MDNQNPTVPQSTMSSSYQTILVHPGRIKDDNKGALRVGDVGNAERHRIG